MPWVQLPNEVVLWHTSLQLHESLGCVSWNYGEIMRNLWNTLQFKAKKPSCSSNQVSSRATSVSKISGDHCGTTHVTARRPCLNHKTVHDASHWVIIRFVSFLVASAKDFWGEPTSLQECQLKDRKHPKAINSQGIEKAHLCKLIHKSMDQRINRLVDR